MYTNIILYTSAWLSYRENIFRHYSRLAACKYLFCEKKKKRIIFPSGFPSIRPDRLRRRADGGGLGTVYYLYYAAAHNTFAIVITVTAVVRGAELKKK